MRIGVAQPQLSVCLLRHLAVHLLGQNPLDRSQCRFGMFRRRPARLGHVRTPATALAAERGGADPHQLDGIEAVGQIRSDADDDRGLTLGPRHDRHDA